MKIPFINVIYFWVSKQANILCIIFKYLQIIIKRKIRKNFEFYNGIFKRKLLRSSRKAWKFRTNSKL